MKLLRAMIAIGAAALAAAPAAHASPAAVPGKPPPPPAIAPGARTFVVFAGRPAPVRLAWPAAPNVARYRARWKQGGALVDVELPGTATAFEREVSAVGHHQLTVIAIDAAGRESAPVEIPVDVVAVVAIAPGSEEPTPPSAAGSPGAAAPVAFAIGARFRSVGLTCRVGDGQPGAEATAREAGATTLRCGAQGGSQVDVPVVIAPVIIEGPKEALRRGRPRTIHLTVASVAPLGERLEVAGDGDVDVGEIRRTAHGLEVTVTARAGAKTAGLVVRGHGTQLGRVGLALDALEVRPPPGPGELGVDWRGIDLGYILGVFVPGGEPATIGAYAREVTARPIGGGRLGVFPTERVGIEVELAAAPPDYRRGHRTYLVSARAQLAARVLDRGDVGLRLVGGAGALNVTGAVHYGGALTFETRRNLWLRFGALHVITAARDAGYTHCLELQLGLVTRLGRRDR